MRRPLRPSFAKSALRAAFGFGGPYLRGLCLAIQLLLVRDCLLCLRYVRDPRGLRVLFRGVCSGALLVSLRDVEGLVRLAPRWLFGGAHLCGSEMAASLLGLVLVGLLMRLVLLAAGLVLAWNPGWEVRLA